MTLLPLPVSSADVDAAARVLASFAVRTPLLSPPVLSDRVGAKVFLKPEMLQRTGSFKFRGAFNKLSSIPTGARGGGVVAFSSGVVSAGIASDHGKILGEDVNDLAFALVAPLRADDDRSLALVQKLTPFSTSVLRSQVSGLRYESWHMKPLEKQVLPHFPGGRTHLLPAVDCAVAELQE